MIIEKDAVIYSWFEIEMARYLMGMNGAFSRTNEILHERNALWAEIQRMKQLARMESPEMAGD